MNCWQMNFWMMKTALFLVQSSAERTLKGPMLFLAAFIYR